MGQADGPIPVGLNAQSLSAQPVGPPYLLPPWAGAPWDLVGRSDVHEVMPSQAWVVLRLHSEAAMLSLPALCSFFLEASQN